ncbi:MAG: ABC transporter permease [Deltaproteobacteria bacterium]|nr:ABC transporter permease [Deltaproteobacteria bacterium]
MTGRPKLAQMAWRNLWRNRRRTVLTLSSIAFGVLLAVLFTAIQDRNWAETIDLAARMQAGHVTIQHADYLDNPMLAKSIQETKRLMKRALSDPNVRRAVVRVSGETMLRTAKGSYGAAFIAFDPAAEDPDSLSFLEGIQGAGFESSDDDGIVLGETLARNLKVELGKKVIYTLVDKQGEITSGMGRLRGVVRSGAPGVDAGLCLLPIDTIRKLVGYGPDEATQVALFLDDARRSSDVAARLEPDLPRPATALGWEESQPQLAGFIALKVGGARVMEIVIALLVAAGIFNTLFVSVMERMREFGILMAIGYSPGQLFRTVLWESVWLGMVGLLAGAAVTAWPYFYLAEHGLDMSAQMGSETLEVAGVGMSSIIKVGIYPENAVMIGLAVLLATVLAGLFPAIRAGRVQPVESIKLV